MIHWLVLTGGASSRFGQDKASTELLGRTLVDRAVDVVSAVEARGSVTLVGPERAGGPAAAIVSVMPDVDSDYVGILAVDMPFAKPALGAVLEAWRSEGADHHIDAWVPMDSTGRHQWLCAVYRRSALLQSAGQRPDWEGVAFHALVGQLATSVVRLAASVSLLDIDTPEDFQRALDAAKELGA